ncbi:MAG: signal peptide peptidase SppA [Bacteroidia bacterium]|nr:signal peptide peptidase SppA [Bacteroidia bacterium]
MNNFWKTFFGSAFGAMVGVMVSSVLAVVLVFVMIGAMIGSGSESKAKPLGSASVLHLKLDYALSDQTNNNPFENLNRGEFSTTSKPGLYDLVKVINHASSDDKIKGIYLEISEVPAGMANAQELRKALVAFRTSGKFVYTYSDVLTQKGLYLATAGDKIFLNPAGDVEFKGLSTTFISFKRLLDKMGVQAEVFRPEGNKFKSAVEPFFLEKMSPENRAQTFKFLNTMWAEMVGEMSDSRKIAVADMNRIADGLEIYNTMSAVKLGMADSLLYKDQFISLMKKKCGIEDKEKLRLVGPGEYFDLVKSKLNEGSKDNKIAVVFAEGEIVYGKGDNETIGNESLCKQLQKAREDDKVKAVVLRVNSPGGSALASEIIWREVEITKAKKPVIVSMGNLAASGGYYISCGANKIYADPGTLTGSIGVFGMLYNAQGLLNDKLGILTDTVKTNRYSDFFSFARNMEDAEKTYLNRSVNDIYQLFLKRVSDGRKMSVANVDSIAQGRVWAGRDALGLGLVDELGTLQDAIAAAAKEVNVTDYSIMTLPESGDFWQSLFEQKDNTVDAYMKKNLGEGYKILEGFRSLEQTRGVQARMPFNMEIQ